MLSFSIATRFLRKSLAQTSLIVAGIAVGIAVQVFVGSLIASLQGYLLQQTVGTSPHLTLTVAEGAIELDEYRSLLEDEPQVTDIAPVRRLSVIAAVGDGESAPLQVTGAEIEALDGIYGLSERITKGDAPDAADEAVVGVTFAEENGIAVGDDLEVVLPDGQREQLTVSGLFDLGVEQANTAFAFTGEEFTGDALGLRDGAYTAIEVQLEDVFASDEVAEGWNGVHEALEVADWQEQNAQLLSGLQSQSSSSYIIQVFVVIAVALGIASTLTVSAVQKTRQIGILKAIGLSDVRAGSVFFWQAAILGLLGVGFGVALGYGLIEVFAWVGRNNPGLFPISAQPAFIAISSAVGLGIALLSSVIPARNTARLDPIEVIQRG